MESEKEKHNDREISCWVLQFKWELGNGDVTYILEHASNLLITWDHLDLFVYWNSTSSPYMQDAEGGRLPDKMQNCPKLSGTYLYLKNYWLYEI